MLLFGIDLWFTWALLTFLLNYVPYIGSLLATIPPLILGFILLDPTMLLILTVLCWTNQQLWGNVIETVGPVEPLTSLPCCCWSSRLFVLGLGHHRHDSLHSARRHSQDRSREHRCHRPLAILLSERAPTLEEAWREAIKDGRITAYEERMLNELQTVLGYTDGQVKLISARIAAEYALRRGRLSVDQIELIRVGIDHMPLPQKWSDQLEEIVRREALRERAVVPRTSVFALDDDKPKKSESKHSVKIRSSSVLMVKISVPNSGGMLGSS